MDKKDILVRRNCFEFSAIIILPSRQNYLPCFKVLQNQQYEPRVPGSYAMLLIS